MRFAELHLLRYGRFENCILTFPSGGSDLQIILGANEAGKSTTLSAVGDLLFGFPTRTRFAFRFDQKVLRVGAVLDAGGTPFEVRRKKGNLDTLLGPDDVPVDPSSLTAHLDGQTRESFERMFGLDHARLRAGGKAILDNKDDVGAAIFAAGSGLVQVARVCEKLDAEAKEIWAKNAGEGRRYNAAFARYQAGRVKLREVEVRPSAWTKARKELEGAEGALDVIRAERLEVSQRLRKIHRQQLVLPPSARRQEALTVLSELGGTPELSSEATKRCEVALGEAHKARTEVELAKTEIERLESELEGARISPQLLAIAPDVDALRELKGAVDQGAAEVAVLQARRQANWTRIQASATEVGWTEETSAAVKARLPGRPAIGELRELLERRRALEEQVRATRDALREAEKTRARLQERANALPPAPDVRGLQDVAREVREAGHQQAVHQAERTSQELEQILGARLRALAPWRGDIADLRVLAMPAAEDIDAALDRLQSAEKDVAAESETTHREGARLDQLRLDRKHTVLAHPAPSRESLEAVRLDREVAWEPLKAHLLGGAPASDPTAATTAFEGLVADGDRVADERFSAAEHAGGLAALERELEKCELLLAQAEGRRSAAEADLGAAQDAFRNLVAPLGFHISPEAYPSWRDGCADAIQTADALDLALQDLNRAQAAEAAARHALVSALGVEDIKALSIQNLLSEADRKVEAATEAKSQEREVKGLLTAAGETLEQANTQAAIAADAETEWTTAWITAVTRAGLAGDSPPSVVRSQIEIIETLRIEADDLLALDAQLDEISQSETAFAERVVALARQGELPAEASPSQIYAALRTATSEALKLEDRCHTLGTALEQARERVRGGEVQLAISKTELAPLYDILPDGDPSQLRDLLMRAAEAGRCRAVAVEAEQQMLGHGESRGLQDLLDEVADAHPDKLSMEAEDLDGQLERLNDAFGAKSEIRQAAKLAFEALDDRPDAAIAAFEIEEARSEMAFQAELYVRKRAEARLLRSAIERYRKEKQGPLLKRASALFATLTLGMFSSLMVDFDDDTPQLAGVRLDGNTVVGVEGMSEGTVDQLFLALRIAAVEDAAAQGVRLPFVADDLFINFDDERAAAGFKVLAELAEKTQVLFFTHHAHLADVASNALHPAKVAICELSRESAVAPVV